MAEVDDRQFAWGADDVAVSQCVRCKHWKTKGTCAAYPDGVPDAILLNQHDHRQPYDGDGGVVFEARSD